MSTVDTIKTQKAQQYEHLNGKSQGATSSGKDAELFDQFSQILDKIAFKLGNHAGSQTIAPAKIDPRVKSEEKVKSSEPEKEAVAHTATAAEEEQSEEVVQADACQKSDVEEAETEEVEEVEEEAGAEVEEEAVEVVDDAVCADENSELTAEEIALLASQQGTSPTKEDQKPVVAQAAGEVMEHADKSEGDAETADQKLAELRARVRVHTEAAASNEQKQQTHQNLEKTIQNFEQLVVENTLQDTPIAKIAEVLQKQIGSGAEDKAGPVLERILNEFLEAAETGGTLQSPESQLASLIIPRIMSPVIEQSALGKFQDVFGKDSSVQGAGSQNDSASYMKKKSEASSEAGEAQKGQAPKQLTRSGAQRTLERVEQALKSAAESRDGKTISLRLDPPSLGNVRVDVSIRDGVLHARVSAENSAVNQMLRERAHELQRSLRDLGLDVDQVSVSVQGDSGNAGNGFNPSENSSNTSVTDSGGDLAQGRSDEEDNEDGGAVILPAGEQAVEDHWVA